MRDPTNVLDSDKEREGDLSGVEARELNLIVQACILFELGAPILDSALLCLEARAPTHLASRR